LNQEDEFFNVSQHKKPERSGFSTNKEATMTPAEIKAALLMLGITQAEIGEVIGKPRSRVGEVVNGRSANLEIRTAIAEAIGKPITEVFPDEVHRRPSGRIRIPSDYYQAAMAAAG